MDWLPANDWSLFCCGYAMNDEEWWRENKFNLIT